MMVSWKSLRTNNGMMKAFPFFFPFNSKPFLTAFCSSFFILSLLSLPSFVPYAAIHLSLIHHDTRPNCSVLHAIQLHVLI